MRITDYLNATEEAVRQKEFNVVLGLSLGNKYFTPERIRAYLLWGIENTKEKMAVIIPDKIQAINYEVKNGYNPKRALAVAMRKGEELDVTVRKIITDENIPALKVRIIHWEELEDDRYRESLKLLQETFDTDQKFRNGIIEMVRDTPHIQSLQLPDSDLVRLSKYIIDELPVLIHGLTIGSDWYSLFPYPGFAKLDYLALDLQKGTTFPELTAQLNVRNTLHFIEAYAE